MLNVLLTILSYLIGAIPFGLLVARAHGVDLRTRGSGNIGATNVFRVVGKGWGILTFTIDAFKGFIPAFFFVRMGGVAPAYGVLFGVAAILGHTFPVYLRFKGGKGVATSAGVLLGVAPLAVAIAFCSWLVCMVVTRYVSLSSIIAALVAMFAVWTEEEKGWVVKITLSLMALLIIWLHRANIRRLINGTENRFGSKQRSEKPANMDSGRGAA